MEPDTDAPNTSHIVSALRTSVGRIRDAIEQARRDAEHGAERVSLVVVTKSVPTTSYELLERAGVTDIGENRVQAAQARFSAAPTTLTKHGIGSLQRNKARRALDVFDTFHALDRLSLAATLQRHLEALNRTWPVFVQVNASGEAQKSGFSPDDALDALKSLQSLDRLRVRGWMTMAEVGAEEQDLRRTFSTLRWLRDEAIALGIGREPPSELSMGMSADYVCAVQEGATLVRIGRAAFHGVPIPDPKDSKL